MAIWSGRSRCSANARRASSAAVAHFPIATSAGSSACARSARTRLPSGGSGLEHREDVEGTSGVGEQHRLVQRELAARRMTAEPIAGEHGCAPVLRWASEAPHQVAGVQLDDRHQEGVVVGGRRLRRLQDPLRFVEAPSSWSASPSSSPTSGVTPSSAAARPSRDLGEVVAVARQPGCLQEEIGVGGAGRLEPRGRHADRVFAATSAVGFDAVGQIEQEAATRERRHRRPQDLAVQRVREADLLAATVGTHGEKAPAVERFECVSPDGRLEDGQAGRLPHRRAARAPRAFGSSAPSRRDELVEPRGRDEWTGQAPHTPLVEQMAAVERAEHELADEQDVALARCPDVPDVVASTGPPSTRCRSVSIAAGRGREVDAAHPRSVPQRLEPGGTGSGVRTVATRKTRSASTSCATRPPTFRREGGGRRRTGRGAVSVASRTTGRTASTTATRSHDRRRCRRGSRWASAPSGRLARPPSPLPGPRCVPAGPRGRGTGRRGRVLPTPAGPWITKPCARGSASDARNVSSSSCRPTSGHCNGSMAIAGTVSGHAALAT